MEVKQQKPTKEFRHPIQRSWHEMNRKQRREMARKIEAEDLSLEVVHPDTAGIDIGNESHYAAGRPPEQAVVDGGFTSRETMVAMDQRGVDFIGSMGDHSGQAVRQFNRRGGDPAFRPGAFSYHAESDTYTCPDGTALVRQGKEKRPGVIHHQYRASAADCAACAFKGKCCPQNVGGRMVVREEEAPTIVAFRARMETDEAKQIYRQRGAVAEFPNAWIKEKTGLRQFHLRGLLKVTMEALWACLTYNIQQWIRLRWRRPAALRTA